MKTDEEMREEAWKKTMEICEKEAALRWMKVVDKLLLTMLFGSFGGYVILAGMQIYRG